MRRLDNLRTSYFRAILIIGVVTFGLLMSYIKITTQFYEKNINRLKQTLVELEQSKLENEVNELIINLKTENAYVKSGYRQMLEVTKLMFEYLIGEKSLQDEEVNQYFCALSNIYGALEIRVYDRVNDRIVSETKHGETVLVANQSRDNVYSDFAFYREFTIDDGRYVIIMGVSETYLNNLYKSRLQQQFESNLNLDLFYTIIEIDNYEGGDDFAYIIHGQYLEQNCHQDVCPISTDYQDEAGYALFEDMLNSLNQNDFYSGYVQDFGDQYLIYAKLYKPYNLIIMRSQSLKDVRCQTAIEIKILEDNLHSQIQIAIIIGILIFFIAGLSGFILFKYLKSKAIENEREQNRIIAEHNRVLSRKNDQINQIAHDIRNHLMCIKGFISQEEINVASEYIDSIYEDFNQLPSIVITGNQVVDIILNDKISQMKKAGIIFKIKTERVSLDFVDFKEMTIILTNMLDNAIESCLQSEKKEIQFMISLFNETYIRMKVINSCDQAPTIYKGKLRTTKAQKAIHGYGIKNIERSISKYNGETYFKYDEQFRQFTFMIVLEIPNQTKH